MSFYPDGTPIYDDAEAYESDDPKSAGYSERMLEWGDMERKRRKEDGPGVAPSVLPVKSERKEHD